MLISAPIIYFFVVIMSDSAVFVRNKKALVLFNKCVKLIGFSNVTESIHVFSNYPFPSMSTNLLCTAISFILLQFPNFL